jgi:hypothetical protein
MRSWLLPYSAALGSMKLTSGLSGSFVSIRNVSSRQVTIISAPSLSSLFLLEGGN